MSSVTHKQTGREQKIHTLSTSGNEFECKSIAAVSRDMHMLVNALLQGLVRSSPGMVRNSIDSVWITDKKGLNVCVANLFL